jgi:hypothetical protein
MMAAWRGCAAEPPTVRLAVMEAAEEATDLRVGGGGHAGAGEEAAYSSDLEGWPGRARPAEAELEQGGATRYAEARRPRAGWVAARPAVGWPEVEKKALY